MRDLKTASKNIWMYGGGELTTCLSGEGLIDHYRIFGQPVGLGKGIPLFGSSVAFSEPKRLELVESKKYGTGMMLLSRIVTADCFPHAHS